MGWRSPENFFTPPGEEPLPRAFALINHGQKRSSNMGFRTLHVEQGSPTGGTRIPKGYEDPWVTEQLIYLL